MKVNKEQYQTLKKELDSQKVELVAVSKTKPVADILELYELGQRDFAENYVQELLEKASQLPGDIRWHFIGHLQTNKVKLIVPFVQLIQGVDSLKLLKEIDKQGMAVGKQINCLLQVHIAREETKFGLNEEELDEVMKNLKDFTGVKVTGLMGMASFTENLILVREEFKKLKNLFDKQVQLQTTNHKLQTLSMGMSSDYKIAVEEGSTMVRIGSLLFGNRT